MTHVHRLVSLLRFLSYIFAHLDFCWALVARFFDREEARGAFFDRDEAQLACRRPHPLGLYHKTVSTVVVYGLRIFKFQVRGIPRPQALDPRTVRDRKQQL